MSRVGDFPAGAHSRWCRCPQCQPSNRHSRWCSCSECRPPVPPLSRIDSAETLKAMPHKGGDDLGGAGVSGGVSARGGSSDDGRERRWSGSEFGSDVQYESECSLRGFQDGSGYD
eukprot:206095-Prorocentrum_minimum.AAC.1